MPIHPTSEHPEWYVESLVDRYQHLVDEMANLKSRRIVGIENITGISIAAILAYFAFGNFWAAILFSLLIAFAWNFEQRQKRFLIASQMLSIEAEFPDVKQNVAWPTGWQR